MVFGLRIATSIGFKQEMPTANSFTKHLYALALYERGETERASEVIKESLERSKLNADALVSAVETLQLMKQLDESRKLAKDYLTNGSGWDCLELSIYVLKYFAGDIGEEELLKFAYPFHSSVCHIEHMVGVWRTWPEATARQPASIWRLPSLPAELAGARTRGQRRI